MRFQRPHLRRPSLPARPRPGRGGKAALAVLGALVLAGAGFAAGWLVFDDSETPPPPVAPTVVIEEAPEPEAAEQIGFPAFGTFNTTRVGGADPVAVAAGVALAGYPTAGGVGGPGAVILAPTRDWRAALAASSLIADPISAPLLLGAEDEIPGFTAEALAGLAPRGLEQADGAELIAVGNVATPERSEVFEIRGRDPAELAAEIDRRRRDLGGPRHPDHILVVPSTEPALAMPAAAWAARSGDPIVFAAGDEVPDATLEVLGRHPDAAVYVLGPAEAISNRALRTLAAPPEAETGEENPDEDGQNRQNRDDEPQERDVTRVGEEDPVENAIAFARFADGEFGWNINDPGHGFTVASAERPLDAAAGAPLAARGKPGPLLLTDGSEELPPALRGFLLDTKPGYSSDPSRAFYNHIWVLGDTGTISLAEQAQIDELTRLVPIREGRGGPRFELPPASQGDDSDEEDAEGDGGRGAVNTERQRRGL
jgi:hypothetical protein